ncbi:HlyD family secretion protein [Opitutus sp. ER46]|uniref:HlyD family secretion protein n=1 Tax=Opitutus sp. ER46 TaxID=2161864 RepID=UPI000D30CE70|nr:HlyD family secretion protein [Opitutus sp. ER46]PTX91151.1 hemolysin secretion protein D [Opitutus sp. ER46]
MSTHAPTSKSPARSRGSRLRRRILLVAGPVVLLAGGLFAYLHGGRVVTSDNAYVRADKLTVTAEIAGAVKEVSVRDNQHVTPGQVLFRLDDEPYRIAVTQARAQLSAVRLELATLRGSYRQKLAAIDEAREQAAFAQRELQRQEALSATHVAPDADVDRARHALDAATRRIAVLERDAATTLASLGGADAADEQNPRVLAAQAQLAKAERDLRHTVVVAPIAGVVANVSNLPVGRYLQPAQAAFALVATDHVWIEANLKETELTYLKSGDPVDIEVDTYPHFHWQGHVADVGPATGAEFALIPTQNASGNWVKTVQRIPVRVRLDTSDPAHPLRAGMSAEVSIDTGHLRSLHDLTQLFGADRRG